MFASVVLPLLVMPLMLFASHWSIKKHETHLQTMTYRYAVSGAQAAAVRSLVAETQTHKGKKELRLKEVQCDDPVAALNRSELEFVLEGLTPAETQASEKKKRPKATRKTSGKKEMSHRWRTWRECGSFIAPITISPWSG